MSNCCFDKNSFEDIFNKIIGEHPEISIISYKPFSGAKYKRYKLPVSWMENQPFWVYDEK